jgi:hypothetical protein
MPLAAPVDREFRILQRGHIRDKIVLATFREGLRALRNPETGNPFTEDEIQRATRPKSRWYNEAQAIDDYGQGEQRSALYMADQIRVERASGKWLLNYHGRLFDVGHLAANGGSGLVNVGGVPGTIVIGSTTPGDPTAYKARDPSGTLFQVFTTEEIDADGTTPVTMLGVTTGAITNIPAGTVLTWTYRDPNMNQLATVASNFTGGTDRETDAELASRIAGIIRHRPGAGNDAHFRAWAREALNAIEDGFVFPCAFHAGSLLVAITQKRGTAIGPLGRVPSVATLAAAIAYLTPPSSPVVPPRPHVIVTPANTQGTDVVVRLTMAKGSAGGWADVRPFPAYHATTPKVSSVASQTDFQIVAPGDATLPGQAALATLTGVNAPKLMLWNEAKTEWQALSVSSVQDLGGNAYRVLLSSPPNFTIAVNQFVSPDVARRAIVSATIQEYFDQLGPGELFDTSIDPRGGRCVRFPFATEERPYRAGAVIASRIIESLSGSSADGVLASMSATVPTYPTNLTLGPNMLVPGQVGIYEL